ncbi:TRAP transporter small permease [Paracoccus sp. (in: a-proteobacteria)]|uniref:TRAP transporter small permease n=1 Tax=Paracoccus sp. TaxID=267 RepID=UPI003A89F6F0
MLFRIKSVVERTLLVLMGVTLAVMVALMLWQVFTRYVLATPALFTEETLRFTMIWMALLGTAYCFGTRKHLALELVPHRAGPRGRKILMVFNGFVTIAFAVITMFLGGLKASGSAMAQLSPIMQLPIGLIYLVLPLSAVLIVFLVGIEVLGQITGHRETPADPQETQ